MPTASNSNAHNHRRKNRGLDLDDDDTVDYSNAPLETSVVDDQDVTSPFRDAKDVDEEATPGTIPTEANESSTTEPEEEMRVPRTEVPLEDLLAPPRRKDEKISGGYEMVSSPQARVYTIEDTPDPSMSIISSGDESWEHVSQDGDDDEDRLSVITADDRKRYAEVLKQPSPAGGKEKQLHPPPSPHHTASTPNSPRIPPPDISDA